MPTITKKELLEKVFPAGSGIPVDGPEDFRSVALHTARALGFEVVEEPELPRRLATIHYPGKTEIAAQEVPGGTASILASVIHPPAFSCDPRLPRAWFIADELVRRWNAKPAVLAMARSLEASAADSARPQWSLAEVADRLRRVYEDAP